MNISTEIASAARLVGEERAVELCAKAGFDAWDFSMFGMKKNAEGSFNEKDWLALAKRLRKIGRDCGIVCNQSHAPFPSMAPEVRPLLELAIQCTAEAGGEICIIHPDNNSGPEENARMYQQLLPFAKSCGVKIATENMWNWNTDAGHAAFAACATPDSFISHLDAVNDGYLVACLDIGHAEMQGLGTSAPEMIRALGSRLKALHIHDNDRWHDSHQIPGSMDIDFDAMVKALADMGYDGFFTLEADRYLSPYGPENVLDGLKELATVARKLADRFEMLQKA